MKIKFLNSMALHLSGSGRSPYSFFYQGSINLVVGKIIHMYKFVLIFSYFWLVFILSFISEDGYVYATEEQGKQDNPPKTLLKRSVSCTERCHVNYMAYENEFKVSNKPEIFRHKTHSYEQDMECVSCHDSSEVNTEGHGKLTIENENCLKCHHVELKESECKRCHQGIDENPMKYKKERFIHGFTVESDVDCGLCHVNDPNASLKDEEINCVKCHHTTPELDCVKCHKDDIEQYFNTDPQKKDSLSWTVSFKHSQHPEQDLSCKECHSISHENDAGIVEYNLNCSKCHHGSEEKAGCIECHKDPLAYLKGEIGVKEVTPVPDMMSRAVKCEDCHKYNHEKLKFGGVKEYCIECHNEDYGKLYNAWTDTIKIRLKDFNFRVQSLFEDSDILYISKSDIEGDKNGEIGWQSDNNKLINEIDKTVDLITKYGIHNFNLTRKLLDYVEERIK
ncbi:MAG: cytochrome c3 family protein [Planctomycetota bacterium]